MTPDGGRPRHPRRRDRRRRWGLVVPTLLVGVVLAVVVARAGLDDARALPRSPVPPSPLVLDAGLRVDPDAVPLQRAVAVRVIDGDTLVARLGGGEHSIRLFGLDAPEADERCAAEAAARLGSLVPAGATLLLHPGPRNSDGDRLLRYAFLPNGRSLDATLVAEGLALAWRRDGQLRDAIVALEGEARRARAGCLWAP
ncbi:MAG: thermonuclease family protein [Chloroflexi bacterium]|nr:thermonuclease family protein [Chloroflexota bacterium]